MEPQDHSGEAVLPKLQLIGLGPPLVAWLLTAQVKAVMTAVLDAEPGAPGVVILNSNHCAASDGCSTAIPHISVLLFVVLTDTEAVEVPWPWTSLGVSCVGESTVQSNCATGTSSLLLVVG
jgi:hypothetical protein